MQLVGGLEGRRYGPPVLPFRRQERFPLLRRVLAPRRCLGFRGSGCRRQILSTCLLLGEQYLLLNECINQIFTSRLFIALTRRGNTKNVVGYIRTRYIFATTNTKNPSSSFLHTLPPTARHPRPHRPFCCSHPRLCIHTAPYSPRYYKKGRLTGFLRTTSPPPCRR